MKKIQTNIAKIILIMPNSKDLFEDSVRAIQWDDVSDEKRSIVLMVFEHLYGLTRTDILLQKEIRNYYPQELTKMLERINAHEPIQYVLGECEFYGMRLNVTPDVLIPRPETELVVDEVLNLVPDKNNSTLTIIDIGTGSGCIAIAIAKHLPGILCTGIDVSQAAIGVAEQNAREQKTNVRFFQHDIFESNFPLPLADVIVSNPPYITPDEKNEMSENVLLYEPHHALFVPEEDPLIFYRRIAEIAGIVLVRGGVVIVEINERFGKETSALFSNAGFSSVEIIKDIYGKDRVVKASRLKETN